MRLFWGWTSGTVTVLLGGAASSCEVCVVVCCGLVGGGTEGSMLFFSGNEGVCTGAVPQ